MAQNTVTVNGVSVGSVSARPTHISIRAHQESALTQLLKAAGSLRRLLLRPPHTGPPEARRGNGQLALGAIAAGAGAIVHDKRGSKLSGCLSGLLTLAGLAAALATVVFGVRSLIWQTDDLHYKNFISVCDRLFPVTTTTSYKWRDNDSDWRAEECRTSMKMTLHLFLGFCVLLTVVCILSVTVSLASLGLRLRSVGSRSSRLQGVAEEDEEESKRKLLRVNPGAPPTSPAESLTVVHL